MSGRLIKSDYFNTWESMLDVDLQEVYSAIEQIELEPHSFTFYTSVSVMSSSKIEGEEMDVDSFVKHKILNVEYLPELTEKPNDLYNAYLFAKQNKLNRQHFLEAHKILTAHLLPENQRGQIRKTEMLVMEHKTGRIQYEAAPLSVDKQCYADFWDDLNELLNRTLTIKEIFYFASFIHLILVNIHPFSDGNGRISRLLEKWFLAEKLGERAWYIQSEKYYYKHVNDYYKNLARLGLYFESLDYKKSVPFLLMLPESLVAE